MFRLLRAAALLATLTAAVAPALAETVAFQSRLTGGYVGTDRSGLLVADARGPNALVLDMIRLDGRRVAFRDPDSGQFLRAGVGEQTFLAVASPHIRGWETFELVQNGPDVAIRAEQNGLYIGTDGSPRLTARWATRGQGQLFRLVPVGTPAPAPAPAQQPAQQSAEQGRPIAHDLPFAGRWVLDDLFVAGVNDRAMRRASVQIGDRGALSGDTGCNTFSARLMDYRSAFRTENFLITRRRCQGVRDTVERHFSEAMAEAAHFARIGNRLEIRDWNGRLRARMIRD